MSKSHLVNPAKAPGRISRGRSLNNDSVWAVRFACCPSLIDDNFAPAWLAEIPFVQWDRSVKNLDNVPGCTTCECLLLDDSRDYVVDSQLGQWIEIEKFQSPYPETDMELTRVQSVIEERLS